MEKIKRTLRYIGGYIKSNPWDLVFFIAGYALAGFLKSC